MGKTVSIRIEDILDDGRGFGRYEGLAVFVSGSGLGADGKTYAGGVPGDLIKCEITKLKKNSAEASLLEIIEASPDRVTAECPYFGQCGGCTLQELSYKAQLALKTEQVKSKLARLGGLEDPKVNDCVGAEATRYYRNKAVFAVGPHGEVGFKKAGSHFVMDIDDCLLQSDAAMVCADALRAFLKNRSGKNISIGQMTVKAAFGTGEVMVVFEEAGDAGDKYKKGKGKKRKSSGKPEIADVEELIEMLDDGVRSLNYTGDDADGSDMGASSEYESGENADTGTDDRRAFGNSQDEFWSLESVAIVHKGKCEVIAGKATISEEIHT